MAEDEAAEPHRRVAAARELADLDGRHEQGVRLLTELASVGGIGEARLRWRPWPKRKRKRRGYPSGGGWVRALACAALADLPAQDGVGAVLLAGLAADQKASASAREFAAVRLAAIEGRSEQAAALLVSLASDRKTGDATRATSARSLAKIPGHEATGIGLLTRFVADPALTDASRLFAARCSTSVGHGEVGVGLLSQLIDDPAFDAGQRVEAAVLLASIEGQADTGAALLRAFAEQDGFPSQARVRAAGALSAVDGHETTAVEALARLADDVRLGHGEDYERPSRAEAAELLARIPGQLDVGAGRLLRIAQNADGTVGVHQRLKAAQALGQHEKYRATAADLLVRMARDHHLDRDQRANAASSLSYLEGHGPEALRILRNIASQATEPFDHAATLAHSLSKRLEEESG
ncbi:hypothetical protein [Catenulispora acidiphila]|uniref:hypothetical protein n=1 Tax=Catenulispora acidiphila TaxID=304895 RepID=UPI0005A1CB3B|nr:hypothetical protein [Catenulispora acidiphila]